jgi:phospholipase C
MRTVSTVGGRVCGASVLLLAAATACQNGLAPPPLAMDAGLDAYTPHPDSGKGPGNDAGADRSTPPDSSASSSSSSSASSTGTADAAADGPPVYPVPASWNATYTRPSDGDGLAQRQACAFKRGAMPAQTTGPSTAIGSAIPIEHIVVLMQENRSFDSYFGHLAAYEATQGINNTIESAPADAGNPDYPRDQTDGGTAPDAGMHPWVHAPQLCFFDTAHSWGAAHIEYDNGLNDGFYYANNANVDSSPSGEMGIAAAQLSGERAMWWYDQTDLPFYYALYSTFAMADHYHSALLGSTYPNRLFLDCATSLGLTTNDFPNISQYPTPETPLVIFDELAVRGIGFTWYVDGGAADELLPFVTVIGTPAAPEGRYGRNPIAPFSQFLADAQSGNLPAVSFLDGDNLNETTTGNDEHPPDEIEQGQQFVWQVVNAITTSPNWSTTALFITYDENGGIYDHVPPPPACKPDDLAPVLTDSLDQSQPGQFDRYGFRVPFVVVSPYAKKNYVSHAVYSHTSIIRFIEAKFTLPALTARDANEDPFTDMFDWQSPPFMTPPTFPMPTVDQAAVTQCTSELMPMN